MAKYMVLIFGAEAQWQAMTPEQGEANEAGHDAFRAAAGSKIGGGEELEAASTATTLRSDGTGGVTITDGPFLETKEALGGFYLLDAPDLDEVTKLASLLPELQTSHCAVEIRPVVDHG